MIEQGHVPHCVLRSVDPTATRDPDDEPTDEELARTFGEPERLGPGFFGVLDVDGTGTRVWLCALVWAGVGVRLKWRTTPVVMVH